mgnify:CR=1 FL=1
MTDDTAGKMGKRRLGRGLDALFGEDTAAAETPVAPTPIRPPAATSEQGNTTQAGAAAADRRIPVDALRPNRYQPRRNFSEEALRDLTASIRQHGILQPIVVRPDPDRPGRFEIIAGERRWRAAQAAQLHQVPIVITNLDDRGALEVALIENIQRQDLNALEEAEAFRRLMTEFSHTQEKLAEAVGKSRSHIANTLRLLALPETVKTYMRSGQLSAGHARALITAANPEALARQAVEENLSVRQMERLAQSIKTPTQNSAQNSASTSTSSSTKGQGGASPSSFAGPGALRKDANILALEKEVSDALGLKVEVHYDGNKAGRVVIHYMALEQFDDIIRRLHRSPSK